MGATFIESEENALEFNDSNVGKEILTPNPLRIFRRVSEFGILFLLFTIYTILNYNFHSLQKITEEKLII